MLFVLDNLSDIDKIIQNQPWIFDKHLVLVQWYVNDTPIRELVFSKDTFWVQAQDFSIRYIKKKVAECICEPIGEVHKSTGAIDEDGGNFI